MRTVTLSIEIHVADADNEVKEITDQTARDVVVNAVSEAIFHAESRGFDGSDKYSISVGDIVCTAVF